jgi:chemotaxis response regulator CheB
VPLAAPNRLLRLGIAQRKTAEAALKKSREHYQTLLDESLALEGHFRHLTHQLLLAQEAERKKLSRDLRDEIAQTLLGINVRLLALKKAAKGNRATLKKEIANTQRLVQQSVQSINRFASDLDPSASVKGLVQHMNMKTKSKPERRQNKPANAARETIPVSPASRSFPVIAMAASAGGLKALSVILGGLPADFPAAIAIVMHLSPDHKSILAEILGGRTHLEVKQAHTGDILCPSSVFIAPPNHHLFVVKAAVLSFPLPLRKRFIMPARPPSRCLLRWQRFTRRMPLP